MIFHLLGPLVIFMHMHIPRIIAIAPPSDNARVIPSLELNHTIPLNPSNDLTADQNIANVLIALAADAQLEFNQAKLLGVAMTAGGRAPHRHRSASLTDFRKLSLFFLAGGATPATAPTAFTYFKIENIFPSYWNRWEDPEFYEQPPLIWLENRQEVLWPSVQASMPFARADGLLKDAGFAGPYEVVFLHQMEGKPLQWCFRGLFPSPRVRDVAVEVLTGAVRELNYNCAVMFRGSGLPAADF
ncbi:MAG: hypothetical protein Q9220_005746 [cf. Caloplaca sp. 1 TL-2023]